MATTFTRTSETVATLRLVLDEISKMQASGPTDDEVAAAIANLAGSYAMRVSGADDLAAALVTADLHGLAQAYVSDFPLLVAQVTRQEAADAAASVLTPRDLAIVLLGDGDAIAKQLDAAKIPFERVSFAKAIGPQPAPEAAPIDAKSAEAAKKVLEAALAAKGGDKVAKLKSLHMVADGSLTTQGQTLDVEFDRKLVLPETMRMDISIAKGSFKVALVVQGDKGWGSNPGGVQDLPAEQMPTLEFQRWIDPELVLTRHREKGTVAELLAPTKIDGKAVQVVKVRAPDGMEVTLFIDSATKLLVQSRYDTGAGETIETFADYKAVEGIQIAHKRTSKSAEESADLTVTKVEINPTIDPAIFKKPAK
jgi:hypothetical protein